MLSILQKTHLVTIKDIYKYIQLCSVAQGDTVHMHIYSSNHTYHIEKHLPLPYYFLVLHHT